MAAQTSRSPHTDSLCHQSCHNGKYPTATPLDQQSPLCTPSQALGRPWSLDSPFNRFLFWHHSHPHTTHSSSQSTTYRISHHVSEHACHALRCCRAFLSSHSMSRLGSSVNRLGCAERAPSCIAKGSTSVSSSRCAMFCCHPRRTSEESFRRFAWRLIHSMDFTEQNLDLFQKK